MQPRDSAMDKHVCNIVREKENKKKKKKKSIYSSPRIVRPESVRATPVPSYIDLLTNVTEVQLGELSATTVLRRIPLDRLAILRQTVLLLLLLLLGVLAIR